MQRFKNILLVLNPEMEEKSALDKAVSLARKNEARLTLFSVVEKHPDLRRYPERPPADKMREITADQQGWLERQRQPIRDQGIAVVAIAVAGISFLEIIRQVIRERHDLVITTAEEKKGIRTRLFGTTSMHLMRKCPCPVWVVKRQQQRPYVRVLAAVDPSVHDAKRNSLDRSILQLASSMARGEAAELHVTHMWQLLRESDVGNRSMAKEEIQEAKALEKALHKNRFDTLLSQVDLSGLQPKLHLIEGDPDERIPELVIEQSIDLLVMGTVCRTGISGFLIGNTAEEVLNQVDCSVLTVKPEGFVTPVTLE